VSEAVMNAAPRHLGMLIVILLLGMLYLFQVA